MRKLINSACHCMQPLLSDQKGTVPWGTLCGCVFRAAGEGPSQEGSTERPRALRARSYEQRGQEKKVPAPLPLVPVFLTQADQAFKIRHSKNMDRLGQQ